MQKHAGSLQAAQSRFGVDPAYIVAGWGVKSDFGKGFGKRPVMQSLATLVCEAPRRNEYFQKELMAALKIVDNGDVAPQEFYGSWAGAFGHTQFMPSTFLTTAVDLDGDGQKNIASSPADALGSTANYLHKAGWAPGLGWGFEVRLPEGYAGRPGDQPTVDVGLSPRMACGGWMGAGSARAARRCCCRRGGMARRLS